MTQDPKDLHPFVKIMLAETEVERDTARAALHKANAEEPTDREVLGAFLKDCTTLDGASLALNDAGQVSVSAPDEAAPAPSWPRYDSAKPFFVNDCEYTAVQDAVDAAEVYGSAAGMMLRDAIRHAEIQGVKVPREAYEKLASMRRPEMSSDRKVNAREEFVAKMVALHLADRLATPVLTRYSGLYCQVMGQHAGEPDIDYVRRCAAQSFDDANGLLDARGEPRPLEAGDKVFVISEQRLATVLDTYGDGINGDCGDVRVDLCGNTAVTNLEHYDPVEHAQFDATFTPIRQAWKEQYGITKDIPVRHEPVETEIPPERPRG